jgi:DNA uptake protein ComE-like DNA-binding protein
MEGKIGTGDSGEDLKDLKGLTPGMLKKLTKAGLSTIEEVEDAGVEGLSELPGIGEKTAKKIIDLVENN